MCGLLFLQIRARCLREPSGAGDFCCFPTGCACLRAAKGEDSVFPQTCYEPFSRHWGWAEYLFPFQFLVQIYIQNSRYLGHAFWQILTLYSPLVCVEHSQNTQEQVNGFRGESLKNEDDTFPLGLAPWTRNPQVQLQKITLLRFHVNGEGQGRITEMRLDRVMLMAIWGTEERVWYMERQLLLGC